MSDEQVGEKVKDGEETDDDILEEARNRRQSCVDFDGENFSAALADLLFLKGGENQWDGNSVRIRKLENRPMLTYNNLPTFLHQVTNEQRRNTPAIKVHPVDDGADVETAEVIQGMIRHIEYDSNADVAYDTAVNSAAAIGFGWFRLVTEYENEDSFDQKIMFKRVRNALSVHIDPLSQEPDGSDMKFAFVDSLEDRKEFKKQWPDASANDTGLLGQAVYNGWFTKDAVLVTEYYRIKETEATLCELVDGSVGWKDKLAKGAESLIKRERPSKRCVVEWFKLTGSDVLERTVIKCKWIPVFPVYGDEIDIEGRVVRAGIIRNAKDAFMAYNFWMTCATEEVALRPKTPFIMAEGQDEGHENQWANANNRSYSALFYKPTTVDGQLTPAPQRQPMADIPSGMLAMAMHAADNKKAITGLFDSSLGARGSATSGVQERAQQQQGATANSHYMDNLNLVVRQVGRCMVNMFPSYYDGARVVRMLGETDEAEQVQINQPYQKTDDAGNVQTVLHDLTVGTYDITVKAGPNYSTKREEAVEFLTGAMQMAKSPEQAAVITYLAFKNQDLAGAEEATEMLKKLLPPGVAPPEKGQEPVIQTPEGPLPVSQAPQVIAQLHGSLQQAKEALQKADTDKIANTKQELEIKNHDSDTKAFEAATARREADEKIKVDIENAKNDGIRAEADRLKAEAAALSAHAAAVKAGAESHSIIAESTDKMAASVAEILGSQKQPVPSTMTIKAPSGQVYTVDLGGSV